MSEDDLAALNNLPSITFRRGVLRLPKIMAVYFAVAGERILYVGATRNLHQRWNSGGHHKRADLQAERCDRLAWLEISSLERLRKAEAEFIRTLQPPLNINAGSTKPVIRVATEKLWAAVELGRRGGQARVANLRKTQNHES